MSVFNRLSIVTDSLYGNWRGWRFWRGRPVNDFTKNGFEVVPDFLDRAECRRLVSLAQTHLEGPSHIVAGNCYTWVKAEAEHGRNSAVRELLNVNEIDPAVEQLLTGRAVQDLFTERLGETVELKGFSIQMDGVDTATKRGFHVDTLFPPTFKAFIYLTDVEVDGDGPYTVIPGSHRDFARKIFNDFVNAATSAARRDMFHLTNGISHQKLLAPAGTLILSTQDLIHKGWGEHSHAPRFAMIGYGTTAEHFRSGPITEGIEHLAPQGAAPQGAAPQGAS